MKIKDKPIIQKSIAFSIRIINLYKHLADKKSEFVLSKQILRSGTSIGANMSEAYCAISSKDFIAKTQIAFKECSETSYWLTLLMETKFITKNQFDSINIECDELLKLLATTLKTSKQKTSY